MSPRDEPGRAMGYPRPRLEGYGRVPLSPGHWGPLCGAVGISGEVRSR